ncbi:hypothetical protein DID76_03955 [Candidatus Marinamargulisbacteria bacterium SCGC AG-414-C22]|nr:hypothetical protein DID76_03955 [Candidatus Marinamargulisbacteria bacterium SCGC AG-414-C22]
MQELKEVEKWLKEPDKYKNLSVKIPENPFTDQKVDTSIERRQCRIEELNVKGPFKKLINNLESYLNILYKIKGDIDLTDDQFKDIVSHEMAMAMDSKPNAVVKENVNDIKKKLVKFAKSQWNSIKNSESDSSIGIYQGSDSTIDFKKEAFLK